MLINNFLSIISIYLSKLDKSKVKENLFNFRTLLKICFPNHNNISTYDFTTSRRIKRLVTMKATFV